MLRKMGTTKFLVRMALGVQLAMPKCNEMLYMKYMSHVRKPFETNEPAFAHIQIISDTRNS